MQSATELSPDELAAAVTRLGLVDPTDLGATQARRAAPRLMTLAGRHIGLLDNRKPNAATLLAELGTLLVERAAVATATPCSKFIYSRPAAAEIVDELSGYDAVVTAIGD